MQTSTLRPGLLVSVKTSIRGNVQYYHLDIELDHLTEDGWRRAKWVTERTILGPVEYEAAKKVRSRIRSIIDGVCASSAFGLLCPEMASDQLDTAIVEARKLADDFNAGAKLTRIYVRALVGRIAPDDVEAVRSINSEIRDLLADMAEGIRNLDVEAVRNAADRARDLGRMLAPSAEARIRDAIDVARSAARQIVKSGEQAAREIDQRSIRRITEARTAFLDLDEPVTEVAAPAAEARAVDFEPATELESVAVELDDVRRIRRAL